MIAYKWLVLAVVVTGSFTVILDTTVVNVALPMIMLTLGTDLERGQLVLSAYLLALALVVPATGFLSDRLGTKRLYIPLYHRLYRGFASLRAGVGYKLPDPVPVHQGSCRRHHHATGVGVDV